MQGILTAHTRPPSHSHTRPVYTSLCWEQYSFPTPLPLTRPFFNLSHNDLSTINHHAGKRLASLGLTRHFYVERTVQVPSLQGADGRSDPSFIQTASAALAELFPPAEDAYDEDRVAGLSAGFGDDARDGREEVFARTETGEVAGWLAEGEERTVVEVSGEDVGCVEGLCQWKARVEIEGAEEGADKRGGGVFERCSLSCGVDVAAQGGASSSSSSGSIGVYQSGGRGVGVRGGDFVAKVIVIDGLAADALAPSFGIPSRSIDRDRFLLAFNLLELYSCTIHARIASRLPRKL